MIEHKVKTIISTLLTIDITKINNWKSFTKDLKADALDFIELIMLLEEEFNIVILEEDIYCIETVQKLIDYIKNKINCIKY